MKQLWDSIQPSTSFWTWDRQAEHSCGLLTLHLDKQNEGTRWIQVFATADTEVPETLDPSELYKIRESLEKYTSPLRDGEDTNGFGLGKGVPSLGQGEVDDEIDTAIGRQAYITWVPTDDGLFVDVGDEISFNLLSTPIPGIESQEISLIVKNGVDGIVFSLLPSPTWIHTSTFPALAFVLASKQDTRFIYHISSKAKARGVLAFESGGTKDRGGNAYIYRSTLRSDDRWAGQVVLKVGSGTGGALVGVGAVGVGKEGYVLLCLCEGELVVIDGRDVL